MRKDQRGIGLVGVLLLILVILIIGGAGWMVYMNRSNTETNSVVKTSNNKEMNNESNTKDVKIYNYETIEIATVDDVDKLPETVPLSFKEYMKAEVKKAETTNTYCEVGRKVNFSVNKVSSVNIRGGYGLAPSNKEDNRGPCGGKVVWALNSAKSWEMISGLSAPCTSQTGAKIYKEFLEFCMDKDGKTIENTNGSIESVKI